MKKYPISDILSLSICIAFIAFVALIEFADFVFNPSIELDGELKFLTGKVISS